MSEESETGVSGSKQSSDGSDEILETSNPNIIVEDENEICSTQSLNMEDINNIIGVQSNAIPIESTLESEIDALSKIITDDTKEDFQSDDYIDSTVPEYDSNMLDVQSIQDETSNTEKLEEEEVVACRSVCLSPKKESNFGNEVENVKNANIVIAKGSCLNKSLLSIGEAYTSEDSQNSLECQSTFVSENKDIIESVENIKEYFMENSNENSLLTSSAKNFEKEDSNLIVNNFDLNKSNETLKEEEMKIESNLVLEENDLATDTENKLGDIETQNETEKTIYSNNQEPKLLIFDKTKTISQTTYVDLTNIENDMTTDSALEMKDSENTEVESCILENKIIESESLEYIEKEKSSNSINQDSTDDKLSSCFNDTENEFLDEKVDSENSCEETEINYEVSDTHNKNNEIISSIDVFKIADDSLDNKNIAAIKEDVSFDILQNEKKLPVSEEEESNLILNLEESEKNSDSSQDTVMLNENLTNENIDEEIDKDNLFTLKDNNSVLVEGSGPVESPSTIPVIIKTDLLDDNLTLYSNDSEHTELIKDILEPEMSNNEKSRDSILPKSEDQKCLNVSILNEKENVALSNEEMNSEMANVNLESNESKEMIPETSLKQIDDNKDCQFGEITELESAVKFLQESIIEKTADITNTNAFPVIDNIYENDEFIQENTDSISTCEAEIISEATKLENEKKKMLEVLEEDKNLNLDQSKAENFSNYLNLENEDSFSNVVFKKQSPEESKIDCEKDLNESIKHQSDQISTSECKLKIPSNIEVPETVTSLKSVSSQKENKFNVNKKLTEVSENQKIDNSEKFECNESIGSPRIILKIAKSAITECSEPRSPKSPKVHSAANSPNPEECSNQKLGKIKLKISKSGHPSIISNENIEDTGQWHTDNLSNLGMKIKLSKSGDASVILPEKSDSLVDNKTDEIKKSDNPIGMKIKLSKSGEAAVIQQDVIKDSISTLKPENVKKSDCPSLGMKFKLSKSGDASIIQDDKITLDDNCADKDKSENSSLLDSCKRVASPVGVKIKLTKSKDGSISVDSGEEPKEKFEIHEPPKRTDSPIGMKIKLSKSGDASIIHPEVLNKFHETKSKETTESEISKHDSDSSTQYLPSKSENILCPDSADNSTILQDLLKKPEVGIGMKFKLSESGYASIIHSEKSEQVIDQTRKPNAENASIGMKIKISKTGEPLIIHSDVQKEVSESDNSHFKLKSSKSKDNSLNIQNKLKENESHQDIKIKLSNFENLEEKIEETLEMSNVVVKPIQTQIADSSKSEFPIKRKDIMIPAIIEPKKIKLDENLFRTEKHQQLHLETQNTSISQQQMKVISQEISITQVQANIQKDDVSNSQLVKPTQPEQFAINSSFQNLTSHPLNIRPELLIVNENSNSSQDIMIIEEVTPKPIIKVPKKRGRPRKDAANVQYTIPEDPLKKIFASDSLNSENTEENLEETDESKDALRPKRNCKSQRSYAPVKRGRGSRGRGKRRVGLHSPSMIKKSRIDQDLTAIETSTTTRISVNNLPVPVIPLEKSPELFKALSKPLGDKTSDDNKSFEGIIKRNAVGGLNVNNCGIAQESSQENQNWLAPTIKKLSESIKSDSISTLTVIDEETRMSADSNSRSQTPARNMSIPTAENIVNEESQGSVLSTATTESEKIKVRTRRMEIIVDQDDGPFTVEKIAEYEWPNEKLKDERSVIRGETYMIQEQISQYLGVKSFKRKYPELKRRMVDMEERNYLRENGLVSESMCDMGLTAVCSSEVLDIMCSDFPEQYEEYRKYLREKQAKEHSKRQKELSVAANAEKNRIDLVEMAMQSAISWNTNLNKTRKDLRTHSLDLQSFTVHMPKKPVKIDNNKSVNHYPVSLIPGQYSDYYREYTPAELRYYPINTVLYGPMKPNQRKFDSQSEGSQSCSDSDSSSDDSSSSSSEGTQDTRESQSTMDEIDVELSMQKDLLCKICSKNLNKSDQPEVLIKCGTCTGHVHPSCIDLTVDMVPRIRAYSWQCTDCKTCAQCHDPADEDKMLFCDMCDRGYHIYCVGLRKVPQGRWLCQECAVCSNCRTKDPSGNSLDRSINYQWQHEYKRDNKNNRYASVLCVPCSKLRRSQVIEH